MSRKTETKEGVRTTAKDLLQGWNEYYINNDFGIGVQCGECQKWRMTYQYQESKEVPKNWTCAMWQRGKYKKGNCSIPSDLTEADFALEDYPPGTLVWAKLKGYNWWPAMIEDSPDNQEFFMKDENENEIYHVNFFGERPLRNWVKASFIKEFDTPYTDPEATNKRAQQLASRKKAIEQAEEASKISIKERLKKYSFAVRYQGRWGQIRKKDKISLPPESQKLNGLAKNTRKRPAKETNSQAPLKRKTHQSTNEAKRKPEVENPSPCGGENNESKNDIFVKMEPVGEDQQLHANQPQESHPSVNQSESNETRNEVSVKKEPKKSAKKVQPCHANQKVTRQLSVLVRHLPKDYDFRKDTEKNGVHMIDNPHINEEAKLNDGASTSGLTDVPTVVVVSSDNEEAENEDVASEHDASDSGSSSASEDPAMVDLSSDSEDEVYTPEQLAYIAFLKKKFPSFIEDTYTEAASKSVEHVITAPQIGRGRRGN